MVLRLMVVVIGSASTFMALSVQSVFALWTLSSDLVYVLLFPQFVALFYFANQSNAYGSFFGKAACVPQMVVGNSRRCAGNGYPLSLSPVRTFGKLMAALL